MLLNYICVKVDSDSEINWDEDEDLGDTEIPGVKSIIDNKLLSILNLIIFFFFPIVLIDKGDESKFEKPYFKTCTVDVSQSPFPYLLLICQFLVVHKCQKNV